MTAQWIKVSHVTPDKPEVFQIAEELGIDADAVVGKLIRVWIWADQQTRDGNAPSVTRALLDRLSAVTGFTTALSNAGWLEETEGGVKFVNFDRHNGSSSKSRALANSRVMSHRQKKRNCNDDGVTKALPEKRREEEDIKKKTKQKKTYSDEFASWWGHFPRKTHKDPAAKAYPTAVREVTKEHPETNPHEFLILAAIEYARSRQGEDPQYTVNPQAWLNQKRWQDEHATLEMTPDQRREAYYRSFRE